VSDVSLQDVASVTLGEFIKNNIKDSFPIPFTINVDQAKLNNAFENSVSARIEKDGVLKYISDTITPVNTSPMINEGKFYKIIIIL